MDTSEKTVEAKFLKEWGYRNQLQAEYTNEVEDFSMPEVELFFSTPRENTTQCKFALEGWDIKPIVRINNHKKVEIEPIFKYTHIKSGISWDANDQMVEGTNPYKKGEILIMGEISAKEFKQICDELDTGESTWIVIWLAMKVLHQTEGSWVVQT
jgi:hypothetical protein